MIPQRLAALRREMKKHNIAVYVVPTSDFHESEYVGEYFMARTYITGFTGSAGTAVITMTEAGLWTDGRYFVQAARQLEGTTITLYRMGEEGVPTVNEYIEKVLKQGETIGRHLYLQKQICWMPSGRIVHRWQKNQPGFWMRHIAEEVRETSVPMCAVS